MRSARRRNLTTALLATMTIPAVPRAHKVDLAGRQTGWVNGFIIARIIRMHTRS